MAPEPPHHPSSSQVDAQQPLPSASSPLARVVTAVVQRRDKVRFLALQPGIAALEIGKQGTLLLYTWDRDMKETYSKNLRAVMKDWSKGPLVVGFVGGGDAAREMLQSSKPMMTRGKVGLAHIHDLGDIWHTEAGWARDLFDAIKKTPPPDGPTWEAICRDSSSDLRQTTEEAQETLTFVRAVQSRRPVATCTLLGIFVAVFGLEFLFGGAESTPVLLRMGALSPERVANGEIWRLLSCTFLHAGTVHFLLNSYVLWIIGSSVERVLGSWRFVILYALSCLGASLVSVAFLDNGFSVGASGGIWGLLAAEAMMAWHAKGLLPKSMIPGARRAALINFGLNVMISFHPRVDMWAHFGGGAVGALLLISGLLTRSLVKLGDLEASGLSEDLSEARIESHPRLKLAAGFLALLMATSLSVALIDGRPWDLQSAPETIQTPLPGLPFSLAIPKGFDIQSNDPDDPPGAQVGDFRADPGALEIAFFAGDLRDDMTVRAELESLAEALKETPKEARLVSGPEQVTITDRSGITATYRFSNGIEEERTFLLLEDGIVRVAALRLPDFAKPVPKGYTQKVLESLQR